MSAPAQLFDVPGPRGRAIQRIVGAVLIVAALGIGGWFIKALYDKGNLTAAKWEPFVDPIAWQEYLIPGLLGTIQAAAISVVLASVLGLLLGIGRLSTAAWIRVPCAVLVEFFRAVPVLLMMLFAFAVLAFNDLGGDIKPLIAVVFGLTMYNGAVVAELIRSGVHNVARGQREAGLSIGLTDGQTLWHVTLPQAITAMIPALVSQLVVVLKDSALGYVITYEELLKKGTDQLGTAYATIVPAFFVVAALYIALNSALSAFANWVQRRVSTRTTAKVPGRG